MKAAKRKELVNELRNAHFYMGFDTKPKYNSEYKKEYKEHALDFGVKTKDLRRTNFELGQENNQELYKSMMKNDYQKPKEYNPAKLSKETIKDLRQHHFYLGSDKINKLSEAQEQYDKKVIDPSVFVNKQSMVNELRRHKHQFGDDKNDFQTMYDNNYNKPKDLSLINYPKTKDEIKKSILGLRKTNLVIGNHTPQYITTQQKCFSTKFAFEKPITFDKNLKKSHFELGGEQIAYKTTVQDQFYPKEFIPNKLDQNLVKDLRATHFSMGNEQPNYQTETVDKYQGKPLELGTEHDNQRFYKGYYSQGDPDLKDIYTSSYVSDFDKTQPDKAKFFTNGEHIQKWDGHKLHASTFGLGNDKHDWISENHQNFVNYPNAEIQKLEEKTKQDLRQHHADFGIDNNDWKTEHQVTYFDKSCPRTKMPPDMLKDLRGQHFIYGFNQNNYSVSSDKIGKCRGLPAKLDEKLQKELRTHHQIQPNEVGEYGTIYKEQFLWKTPIDN